MLRRRKRNHTYIQFPNLSEFKRKQILQLSGETTKLFKKKRIISYQQYRGPEDDGAILSKGNFYKENDLELRFYTQLGNKDICGHART